MLPSFLAFLPVGYVRSVVSSPCGMTGVIMFPAGGDFTKHKVYPVSTTYKERTIRMNLGLLQIMI